MLSVWVSSRLWSGYLLGDVGLRHLWEGVLCLDAGIHAEEVEGRLVGLWRIGVLTLLLGYMLHPMTKIVRCFGVVKVYRLVICVGGAPRWRLSPPLLLGLHMHHQSWKKDKGDNSFKCMNSSLTSLLMS